MDTIPPGNLYDIIVIGAGPSGCRTAELLSRRGYKVALFEKKSRIGVNVVCSGVISKEAFRRYDLPAESVCGSLRNADLYSPSGKHIYYEHSGESVVVVDRYKFDSMLAKRATDQGTSLYLSAKVKKLIPEENCVRIVTSVNNINTLFKAGMVVIATGVSFNLQESLGMGRPDKMIKGVQTEIRSSRIDALKMFWGNDISTGFFGWAIPLDDGRTRIGVMSESNPLRGLENIVSNLKLDRTTIDTRSGIKRRGISHGMINKSYTNRVLAVGEAAGLVKTTTGGGIYYGLVSAELAANVIEQAFGWNRYDESVLSLYDHLLKREFSKEISLGKYFNNFYSNLGDEEIDRLFDAAVKDKLLTHLSENGRFDWHTNTIYRILRSPNLRKVLVRGLIRKGMNKLAFSG